MSAPEKSGLAGPAANRTRCRWMSIGGDFVPARDFSPAVKLLVRQFEHFTVFPAVAVGIHARVAGQIVPLDNPTDFLAARAITAHAWAREPAVAFLQRRADEIQLPRLAPRTEIDIERSRDDHDVIP